VEELLTSAVMHLALVRSPGTKLLAESDTREYEYMMHPIFAPFFVFSYRRKRKIRLGSEQLLGLVRNPGSSIAEILRGQNRTDVQDPLPDQLRLFEAFYNE